MTVYLQEYRCRLCTSRFVVSEHPVDDEVHPDLSKYARSLNHWNHNHQCAEPHAPRIGTGDFVGFVPAGIVEYDVADDGELVPVEPEDGQSSFVWVPVEKRLPQHWREVVVWDSTFGAPAFGWLIPFKDGASWNGMADKNDEAVVPLTVTHWADGLEGPG